MTNHNSYSKVEESLIISEFESLRDEIQNRLSRIFKLHQGLLLGTLIYGTTFYIPKLLSFSNKGQGHLTTLILLYYSFIFILPFITFVVELICTSEQDAIFRAGTYIRDHIERVHRKSTFRGWEDWLVRQDKVKRRRTSDKLIIIARRFVIIPLYCISSASICAVGCNIVFDLTSYYTILSMIIFLSIYFIIFLIIVGKLNNAQKDEFSSPLYNLLVLDIDGCLMDDNRKISTFNKEAISFIKNKGVQVVLATGRDSLSTKRICNELNLKGLHVTCHGASIYDSSNDQVRQLQFSLSPDDAEKITRKVNELHIPWVAFGSNEYFCMKSHFEFVVERLLERQDIHEDEKNVVTQINEISNFNWPGKISKILCYVNIEDRVKINDLTNSLYQEFQVMMSTEKTLEIIHKNAKKELAVQEVTNHIGKKNDVRSLVVGDYDNDIGILAWGCQAVAPSNASIKVKKVEGVNILDTSNNENFIWEIARAYFGLNLVNTTKKVNPNT